jgi:hypothetical protein
LSRPIIARLHSESDDKNGIIVRQNHQRLLQQNRHMAAQVIAAGMSALAKAVVRVPTRDSGFDPTRPFHA